MLPWARGVFGWNFVFVQDNAPQHVARDTVALLDQHAMSSDVNPIKHAWDKMPIWIRDMDRPPSNLAEWRQAVRQAWRAV